MALAPWPAERVGDDHGGRCARGLLDLLPDLVRRAVRVLRQQCDGPEFLDVGRVHAGVGADQAVLCLADHHAVVHPYDAGALAQYRLDEAGVLLPLLGVIRREPAGLDVVEVNDAAFRFRDDLLCDDDDVAGLQRQVLLRGSLQDEGCDIIARAHLGDAVEPNNADFAHSMPMMRTPVVFL